MLELLVDRPGKLDAARVGERIWRPRITSTADVLSVRRAIATQGAHWTRQASVHLQRLTDAGYVERCRPPRVAEEWADTIADDPRRAVEQASAEFTADADQGGARAALLSVLVRSTPATVREWVGTTPSGHLQRAMADLVTWGLVVPPSYRWPTPKGVALVTREES